MTTHLPAALLPLLLALVQGLLLWALWSLRRSFVPQAEHLRCRRDEQRREALWLRRLDLLEQALAQERELLTPLADEVRSLREDAGRLHSQLQVQEARFYGLERLLQRLERHLERQEDRWQQLPGAALPALLHSPGGAVMPVRRRKKALEKALHERLQRLTEHLDTAEVSEKSIDIVKEIKELHALARTLEQEGTSQDGDRKPPAPLRVIWAGQEPEDGLP